MILEFRFCNAGSIRTAMRRLKLWGGGFILRRQQSGTGKRVAGDRTRPFFGTAFAICSPSACFEPSCYSRRSRWCKLSDSFRSILCPFQAPSALFPVGFYVLSWEPYLWPSATTGTPFADLANSFSDPVVNKKKNQIKMLFNTPPSRKKKI